MTDPFAFSEHNIEDNALSADSRTIDGDIVVADSYRRHPQHSLKKFSGGRVLFYFALLLFTVLLTKLYYLQVVRGAEYYGAAEGNRIRRLPITAPRGVIFDYAGARLAYNVPVFALAVIPADLPPDQESEDAILSEVAAALGVAHFDLVQMFARVPRSSVLPFELARGLTQTQAVILESKTKNWPGIILEPVEQRAYGDAEMFAHILGYTGKISENEFPALSAQGYNFSDYVGKIGLEYAYEDDLRGQAGTRVVAVNALGKEVEEIGKQLPNPGKNLYLNIDFGLQKAAWQALAEMIEERESPGGVVVAMDPRSGAIRAMISFPGYDNNLFAAGISAAQYRALLDNPAKPLFGRAVSGEYPSGSTFKIAVAAGGLESGVVTRHTTVESTGGIDVNGYWFPDWKYGGHGLTNISKALAESVNTYFYLLGGGRDGTGGLGVERIVDYARAFGLGALTDIDITSERPGFLPSKEWKLAAKGERWYLGDTYHLAIGQGDVTATPLQITNMTAAVANNGTLYKPRLVYADEARDGQKNLALPEILAENIASTQTLEIIRQGLRQTVVSGSARSLASLPVPAAGKTGTAQHNSNKPPHAWFTGFAPYDNPELVVTVLVEEGEGGDLAATPIAKKIFEYYFGEKENQ